MTFNIYVAIWLETSQQPGGLMIREIAEKSVQAVRFGNKVSRWVYCMQVDDYTVHAVLPVYWTEKEAQMLVPVVGWWVRRSLYRKSLLEARRKYAE